MNAEKKRKEKEQRIKLTTKKEIVAVGCM